MRQQLPGRQPLIEGQVAGQVTEAAPDGHAVPSRVEAEQADLPGIWTYEIEEQTDRRCLARAVGSQEPEDFSGHHLQRYVVNSPTSTKVLRHLLEVDR